MLQNGQTELIKPDIGFISLPEDVHGYVERRSLFVAKRLKFLEKSNKKRFFNHILDFYGLQTT